MERDEKEKADEILAFLDQDQGSSSSGTSPAGQVEINHASIQEIPDPEPARSPKLDSSDSPHPSSEKKSEGDFEARMHAFLRQSQADFPDGL